MTNVLVFGSLIASLGLFCGLYAWILPKTIQRIYFAAADSSPFNRAVLYLVLVNWQTIVLVVIGLAFNHSLIGLEISLNVDEIQILLISGYICYVQESRQTLIRGHLFVKDSFFVLLVYGAYSFAYISGKAGVIDGIILMALGITYHFFSQVLAKVQDSVLKMLCLKESPAFNARFLLTQRHEDNVNVLQLRDLIGSSKTQIEEQIANVSDISQLVIVNPVERNICVNFAKIFIPIMKAYEIKCQKEAETALEEAELVWAEENQTSPPQDLNEQIYDIAITESVEGISRSDSGGDSFNETQTNMIRQSNTGEDFIRESEDDQTENEALKKQNLFDKVIRYSFYPIYILSRQKGRVENLLRVMSFFLLTGVAFIVQNCSHYLSIRVTEFSTIIPLLVAMALSYSPAKYYLYISVAADFDFINMFLQSAILKGFFAGFGLLIASMGNSELIVVQPSLQPQLTFYPTASLIIRAATFLIYTIFMIINRFATRFTNFKVFLIIFVTSQIGRAIAYYLFRTK